MLLMLTIYFMMMLMPIFLMLLNFLLYKSSMKNREKLSPFECGFDPLSMNYMPFSTHFFIISLIFLIFDIEITILIPLIYLTKYFNTPTILTSLIFLIILIIGLYLEYNDKSIDWKI